ncbi:MAG: hypothetical protein QXF82_04750, partial [Nitrososphaeria archaeon]
ENLGSHFVTQLDRLNYLSDNFILKGTLDKFTSVLDRLNYTSDNFILKGTLDKFTSVLDRLNYTSDNFILKGTIEKLSTMLNRLNPASEEFFIKELQTNIVNFFDIFDKDSDKFIFKVLFVPEDNYISNKNDVLVQSLRNKAYIDEYVGLVEDLGNTSATSPELTKTISVYGVGGVTSTFVDTSFYHEHKNLMFTIIRAVIAVGLLIFNINQISKLLTKSNFVDGSFNQTGASDK